MIHLAFSDVIYLLDQTVHNTCREVMYEYMIFT
jgi:hypothetical protein